IVGNDRDVVEIAVRGVLAQFAERLARAEHARRPIDLRIERAKQTEHRPAYCLREKTAQRFFAAMERITAVASEQLVTGIAGERNLDVLRRKLCDLIGR